MYGIGVVVAELMYDFGDAVMVAFGKGGSDSGFETVKVLSQLYFTHINSIHGRRSSSMRTTFRLLAHPRRMSVFW